MTLIEEATKERLCALVLRVRCRSGSFVFALGLLTLPLGARPAEAQLRNAYWGIQADGTPTWRGNGLDRLFDADEMHIAGSEFRVGLARGRARDGHWGISFVRKLVDSDSFIDSDGERRTALGDVRVVGVSLDAQSTFVTITDRFQIGALTAVGIGSARGMIVATRNGVQVEADAADFFRPFGYDVPVMPLARIELAVSVIVVPGFKVRASGGFNYPGFTKFSVGAVYFFEER